MSMAFWNLHQVFTIINSSKEHLELKGTPASKPLHLRNDLAKLILVNIHSLNFPVLKKRKIYIRKKPFRLLQNCFFKMILLPRSHWSCLSTSPTDVLQNQHSNNRTVTPETLRKGDLLCHGVWEEVVREQAHPRKHFRGGQLPRAVVVPSVSTNQVLAHLKPPFMLLGATASPDQTGEGRGKSARYYHTLFRVFWKLTMCKCSSVYVRF